MSVLELFHTAELTFTVIQCAAEIMSRIGLLLLGFAVRSSTRFTGEILLIVIEPIVSTLGRLF